MMMGKAHDNKCIEDLTFVSPSPCYTAALLSALFRHSAIKEKDRATDLLAMGDLCEELNKDLVAIGKKYSLTQYRRYYNPWVLFCKMDILATVLNQFLPILNQKMGF